MADNAFKPDYIEIGCLISLLIIFFTTLFMVRGNGMMSVIDLLLLAGTAAVLGRTVGLIRVNGRMQ